MTEIMSMVGGYYEYKGKTYNVSHIASMKDPLSRQWLPCILYSTMGNIYVRELSDFQSKFTLVMPPKGKDND